MSEESFSRSPTPAAPIPRTLSQPYGAGVRPDSAQAQNQRYVVAPTLIAQDTWNQSQIFDVAAVAAAAFDAALMAAMQHSDPRIANPVEIVPAGMMPPDFLTP
jgi:hypothetical protein